MKNKLFFLFILLTSNFYLTAQEYEEPQWKMPLCFEDATGAKDTLWIGYHPDATNGIDPQFDEGWKWIDTTKFNVYQWGYPNYLPQYGSINTDSVRKTVIDTYLGGGIGFIKGVLPIKLTWNEKKLNSPDLPKEGFPDISPRPRARIDFWFDPALGHTQPDCVVLCSDKPTVILSSYTDGLEMYPCVKSDSAIFDNSNTNIPNHAFIFSVLITPHNYSDLDIENIYKGQVKIQPNIFASDFSIENNTGNDMQYTIFSVTGKEILKGMINSKELRQNINMSQHPRGIYIIKLSNNTKNFTYKLFKTL